MTLVPKLKGSPQKIRKTTKKWPKMGQFAWHKFSLFKFGMMWRPFFFVNIPFLRAHFDRLVLRVKMSHFQGLLVQNWLSDIVFCPVELLDTKIWVKSIILRKVIKWGRKCFFLKIKKNTHQKIRSKATQKCGLTHDFL